MAINEGCLTFLGRCDRVLNRFDRPKSPDSNNNQTQASGSCLIHAEDLVMQDSSTPLLENSKQPVHVDPALDSVETEQHVDVDERLIKLAAAFIYDGLAGRQISYGTDLALLSRWQRFHSWQNRVAFMFFAGIHILLAYFEKPSAFSASWLPYLTGSIEIVCIAYYAFDLFLMVECLSLRYLLRHGWSQLRTIVTLLMFFDVVIFYATGFSSFRFSRPLRPLIFVSRGRNLRKVFSGFFMAMRPLFSLIIFIAFTLVFFSICGYLLLCQLHTPDFPLKDGQSPGLFTSLPSSLYNLFVVTTSLSLVIDVMRPYWVLSRWTALFFILFIVVMSLLFTRLIIANAYRGYKEHARNKFILHMTRRRQAFSAAFALISEDCVTVAAAPNRPLSTVSSHASLSAMASPTESQYQGITSSASFDSRSLPASHSTLASARFVTFTTFTALIKTLRPKLPDQAIRFFFDLVDRDGDGRLNELDFEDIGSLIDIEVQIDEQAWWLVNYPRLQIWRQWARNILLHTVTLRGQQMLTSQLVACVFVLISAVQLCMVAKEHDIHSAWSVVGIFLTVFFAVEITMKLLILGRHTFWKNYWNRLGEFHHSLTLSLRVSSLSLIASDRLRYLLRRHRRHLFDHLWTTIQCAHHTVQFGFGTAFPSVAPIADNP